MNSPFIIILDFNYFMVKLLFCFLLLILMTTTPISHAAEKKVYGLHEKVYISDIDRVVKAKLDTGAITSSLGATNIKTFKRDGKRWIKFSPQIAGQNLPELEKLLVRHSHIKRRVDDIDEDQELLTTRPVVLMNICFDGKFHTIEVNLTDRSRFIYPLLIGATAIKKLNVIVDPSLKYQATANCK